jgi:hypothetical protein
VGVSAKVTRDEITWKLSPQVVRKVAPIRTQLGEDGYKEDKHAFQDFLCGYFSSDNKCTKEQGKGISPLGCPTKAAWKCLKVRWSSIGMGKSSGLRIAVAVHCKDKRVNLLRAWDRNENPSDEDFATALKDPVT